MGRATEGSRIPQRGHAAHPHLEAFPRPVNLGNMHVHASPGSREKTSKVLRISLFVTLAYIVLLVVAGIRAHSLALLSEAGHNLSDFLALLLSLVASICSRVRPAPRKLTATIAPESWPP